MSSTKSARESPRPLHELSLEIAPRGSFALLNLVIVADVLTMIFLKWMRTAQHAAPLTERTDDDSCEADEGCALVKGAQAEVPVLLGVGVETAGGFAA